MRILFDQGVPAPLKTFFGDTAVDMAYEKGWQQLKNGELLNEAERTGYNIFITTDQNLKYQQSLRNRRISIIVLNTTSWPKIRIQASLVVDAVSRAKENSFDEVSFII